MRLAKAVVIGALASFALACTGGITIPSIPAIPSFPPIFPSGGSFPPIDLPSANPSVVNAVCLVTGPEVGQIMGSTATVNSSQDGCSYTFPNFSTLTITIDSGTDLQSAHFLLGTTARDITVGGLPAVSGVFVGQPAVYVQKGANVLQLQGILTGSDDATIAKIVQVAELAVSRWPG
ncbi:MAG: hypothetical protein ABI797_04025 [Chloroflexota bacterium]